jgi:nucleotide-binding universal stress UspA family protein
MAGELIVGYDGSECAKAALEMAIAEAGRRGCGVVLAFGYEPATPTGEMTDYRHALAERGKVVTDEGMALLAAAGVAAEAAVVDQRPAEGLLALAEQHGSPLIVVGTHGERPLMGAILGSVPHKLMYLSKVPVLVVPAPE